MFQTGTLDKDIDSLSTVIPLGLCCVSTELEESPLRLVVSVSYTTSLCTGSAVISSHTCSYVPNTEIEKTTLKCRFTT